MCYLFTIYCSIYFVLGIDNIPCAAVDWAKFTAVKHHRVCSIGVMTEQEWQQGPLCAHTNFNHFISVGELLPTRYCLAYDEPQFQEVKCSFIALDPERLGEHLNDEFDQDFGDNQFPHFKGTRTTEQTYKANLVSSDEDSDSDSINSSDSEPAWENNNQQLLAHLPASVISFLNN